MSPFQLTKQMQSYLRLHIPNYHLLAAVFILILFPLLSNKSSLSSSSFMMTALGELGQL